MNFQKKFLNVIALLFFLVFSFSILNVEATSFLKPREYDTSKYSEVILGNLSFLFPLDVSPNTTKVSNNYIISTNRNGTKNNLNLKILSEKYSKEDFLLAFEASDSYKSIDVTLDFPSGWDYTLYELNLENSSLNVIQCWTTFGNKTYLLSAVASPESFNATCLTISEILKTSTLA